MTLILTVANSQGMYQSSDYQLIDVDTGAPVSDEAGSKQLEARFRGLHLQLAFTGIAAVRKGSSSKRTIDWLSAELNALPHDSKLQEICDSISQRSAAELRVYGPRGVLTLVLAVATVGKPFRVALISNARWGERPPRAKRDFEVKIHTVKKPLHLISGFRDAMPPLERYRLEALARAVDSEQKEILDNLADINATAARNSGGYISEGCWVTSQVADGRARRFTARDVGEHGGTVPQLQGGVDLADWIRKNFRAAPGQEIRVVPIGGVMVGRGDWVPLPPPKGDPRKFTLSGSSITGLLRSISRQHCASIEITQLDCAVIARCNEAATVPFARVQLSGTDVMCTDFPEPMLPWPWISPSLAIDGDAVPRGWEYTVGYWFERGIHHVQIPQTSRSIRKLAFLGDDDELVITVLESEFAWEPSQDGPSATLQANISWRTRPDGTRG